MTVEALKGAGLSEETAETVDMGIGMLAGGGAATVGVITRTTKVATSTARNLGNLAKGITKEMLNIVDPNV